MHRLLRLAPESGTQRHLHVAWLAGLSAGERRLVVPRAIGDRPVSAQLLKDTAQALRMLTAEATAAEECIAEAGGAEPREP